MKKLIKKFFQFSITVLFDIFIIVLLIAAGFFTLFEFIFGIGRRWLVAVIVGITEGRISKRKILPLVRTGSMRTY